MSRRHAPHLSPAEHGEEEGEALLESGSAIHAAIEEDDGLQLIKLGHKQELKRNHSKLSMLGMAFSILNSWTALSASLSIALPSGGPSAVLWGLVISCVCNICLAASLGEFVSAWPTAGGQYHWVSMIAEPKWAPILSWACGWVNVSGWVFLVASGGSLGNEFIQGILRFLYPDYTSTALRTYIVYSILTLMAFAVNFVASSLPLVTKAAFFWSITGFTLICVVILGYAAPDFQPPSFVFGSVVNTTGYPTGFAWLLGLLQGALGLTGYDSVAHMVEELPHPSKTAPMVMVTAVVIGTATGFCFLATLLFSLTDIDAVITAPEGPLLRIFYQATASKTVSLLLYVFPLLCLFFGATMIMATASRMIYAFARDKGLPASKSLAKIHPELQVPLNALIVTTTAVLLIGTLYFWSTTVVNALLSASVVALNVSYGFPVAVLMARGRRFLPADRAFKLPGAVGWLANAVGLGFVAFTTVLFLFPPQWPVTRENMNYCVVGFSCILAISAADYLWEGRKRFRGPVVEVEAEEAAALVSAVERGDEEEVRHRV